MLFIQNAGQLDAAARFVVPGRDGALRLTEDAIWLTVLAPDEAKGTSGRPLAGAAAPPDRRGVHLRLSYPGANPHPRLEGIDPRPVAVSYFLGSDPAGWRSRVPVWGGVRYVDLFPGIDLEVNGRGGVLSQRLVARRGDAATVAALDRARLRVEGGDGLAPAGADRVRVRTGVGSIDLGRPRIDRAVGAVRRAGAADEEGTAVTGQDMAPVRGEAAAPPSVRPRAAEGVDVIFSTFLGGGLGDAAMAVAVDAQGNLHLTGYTGSPDFPATPGGFRTTYGGGTGFGFGGDAFAATLDPTGTALLSATFLGGAGGDRGLALAVDAAGNSYLTGETMSTNFPTTPEAVQPKFGGADRFGIGSDAFVSKLSPDGAALLYSTYLGGQADVPGVAIVEYGAAIAVDAEGQATVAGYTNAPTFPTTRSALQPISPNAGIGLGDGFVARLDRTGGRLVYATYLGGAGDDLATALVALADGTVLVAGATSSVDFPVSADAYQRNLVRGDGSSDHDAFLTHLNAAGSGIVASTYLGGQGDDRALALAIDGTGRPLVAGFAGSADFPTTPGAFQSRGVFDAFAAKLDDGLRTLIFATYLGGRGEDVALGVAVDPDGNVFLAGQTDSPDFPATPGAFQPALAGQTDAFLAKLNPTGSDLIYASFLGGGSVDIGRGLALASSGNAFLTGNTTSADFPASIGAIQPTFAGDRLFGDAFVSALRTPITSGVALRLTVPDVASAPPNGLATLTVELTNLGRSAALGPVVLTATLPAGLTYAGALSERGPSAIEGDAVVWRFDDLPYRGSQEVALAVRLPDLPIGSRASITWTAAAAGPNPAGATAVITVVAARPVFFPFAARGG